MIWMISIISWSTHLTKYVFNFVGRKLKTMTCVVKPTQKTNPNHHLGVSEVTVGQPWQCPCSTVDTVTYRISAALWRCMHCHQRVSPPWGCWQHRCRWCPGGKVMKGVYIYLYAVRLHPRKKNIYIYICANIYCKVAPRKLTWNFGRWVPVLLCVSWGSSCFWAGIFRVHSSWELVTSRSLTKMLTVAEVSGWFAIFFCLEQVLL